MKLATAASILFSLSTSAAFIPSTFLSKSSSTGKFASTRIISPALTTSKPTAWLKMSEAVTTTAPSSDSETFSFEAEVGRVMDIIINSLYSDRDVFLRELISNASDACDKKRFLSLSSSEEIVKPEIKVRPDKNNNILVIQDSGVGMTKDELVNNLGSIAQSGTRNFVEALGEAGNKDTNNLIGQFGVGFYSGFLVADKIRVVTKSMTDPSKIYSWESTISGHGTYSIAEVSEEDDPFVGEEEADKITGTRLELHLKDDALEYLESSKITSLLNKYSEFIEFPISVYGEKTEYEQVPDVEANKDIEEGEEPKMKTVPVTTQGYEKLNNQKPIWLRSPKDVTDDEYAEFYKTAFKTSYDDPMAHSHFLLEGSVECKSLIYIPGMLPFELSRDMFDENASNIRLYVKRVFINDKFEEIIPRWLKFIKGVVDSDDLPLNVGREILQRSKALTVIRKRLIKKALDMIQSVEEDEDKSKYIMFWNNFGKYMKVGVIEDEANKKAIAPLLRFYSSTSEEEYRSFDDYITSMPEGQKSIYYLTADSKLQASKSPILEKVSSKGYEVLFMVEPLDEITIQNLEKYKDHDLVDVTKEGIDLEDDESDSDKEEKDKKKEVLNEEFKPVLEFLETLLEEKIQKASLTTLLQSSPAALIQGQYGMSPTMQRYMKAQSVAMGETGGPTGSFNQAILELNPDNVIVQDLKRMVEEDSDEKENFGRLLYDVASLTSGYDLENSGDFAKRVMKLMNSKAVDDEDVTDAKDVEVIA